MTQDKVFVGVDVLKDRLDVFVVGKAFAVENDKVGLKRLVARLKALGPVAVGLEASGGGACPRAGPAVGPGGAGAAEGPGEGGA